MKWEKISWNDSSLSSACLPTKYIYSFLFFSPFPPILYTLSCKSRNLKEGKKKVKILYESQNHFFMCLCTLKSMVYRRLRNTRERRKFSRKYFKVVRFLVIGNKHKRKEREKEREFIFFKFIAIKKYEKL